MSITIKNLFQSIFKKTCCLCARPHTTEGVCSICEHFLPWIEDRCWHCGVRLQFDDNPTYCQRCIESPPPFDRTCALFNYDPPLPQFISAFKFRHSLFYGRWFGHLLLDAIQNRWYVNNALPDALLPMPLHSTRLKKRGFNQAVELALPIQKALGINVLLESCQRMKNTASQLTLSLSKRKDNVKDAFSIVKPLNVQHVAIIDDVVTTGNTVRELSKVLRKYGVEQIDIWSICRV